MVLCAVAPQAKVGNYPESGNGIGERACERAGRKKYRPYSVCPQLSKQVMDPAIYRVSVWPMPATEPTDITDRPFPDLYPITNPHVQVAYFAGMKRLQKWIISFFVQPWQPMGSWLPLSA